MSDKIALVTGGGKRLGAKIAAALGADGWHVVVHYNTSGTEAEAVAAAIRDAGGSADTVRFDMDDTAGIEDFMDEVGRVDALINSASIFEPDRPENVTPAQLERTLRVNLVAPVLLASVMAKRHEDRASGCIINLLDQKLFNLNPDFFSYTLAKQALLGVRPENMLLVDSKGIITEARRDDEGINEYKARFARDVDDGDLADAMKGTDVFLGLSVGGMVAQQLWADRPDLVSGLVLCDTAHKIGTAEWESHLGGSESMLVKASTWALMLSGRVIRLHEAAGPGSSCRRP